MFLLDACPDDPAANCLFSEENINGAATSHEIHLTGGTTYYFVVSSDSWTGNINFDFQVDPVTCPTCNDGIKNGDELDVDCGGTYCPACPVTVQDCLGSNSYLL